MPRRFDVKKIPELNYRSFLADAMKDYLDYLDHLGFSIRGPANNLKPIDRFLAESNINRIQQCDNRFWLAFLAQHQGRVRAKTLQNWRGAFNGLCRYLVRQGWLADNPVTAFPVPKLQPYRPYVFSIEELRRFFDWLRQQADQAGDPLTSFRFRSHYVFFHLLYACGLRVSEGVRLTAADYSAEQRTLFIQPSKFLKDRLIPIGGRVASNLDLLLELRQRLFGIPAQGSIFLLLPEHRPYTTFWAGNHFRKVLRHLGIYRPKIIHRGCMHGTPHLHELRRAFAVHRLMKWYREQADVDAKLPLLATYMGHGCFQYTKIYLTLTQQLLSEAGHRFARSCDLLDWMTDDPELG
jgi:integrase/recombinase XerD